MPMPNHAVNYRQNLHDAQGHGNSHGAGKNRLSVPKGSPTFNAAGTVSPSEAAASANKVKQDRDNLKLGFNHWKHRTRYFRGRKRRYFEMLKDVTKELKEEERRR